MDSLIAASARALACGDPLGALKRVALREDPPALALRGIAMAQLGEHLRARELLGRAARGFGSHEELARARCLVAQAELALAMRELGSSPRLLEQAVLTLEAHGDRANALHARLVAVRRLLLLGRLDAADQALAPLDARGLPPALAAVAALSEAESALRRLRTGAAQAALDRAQAAAEQARVPALLAEVTEARAALHRPAARCLSAGAAPQMLRLAEVEALLNSSVLVVDACRRGLQLASAEGAVWRPLARRPVLFALARALAAAWPGDVGREALIETVFRSRFPDDTHRARLRVEIGRLRALLASLAGIETTARGYALRTRDGRDLVLLEPPIAGDQAALLALLADGAAWSTSALALAVDASQRTVQRALAELQAQGQVRSIGRARAQRWLAPSLAGFTTILLLPAALPIA
ncbi:helix-turn-helix domain-containing protein [Paucibacter sp. PLA-PC-4]|uniref:helix-turn-helix domain-containing protein n=1 Tax=Paucibacter sp. PLA-PC-4 TaxID=2993655 RepID=UPI002248F70E|nr:helix-turn-helix domain-containing protein [Paucibacter sp. PLA-PC-4]MCX2860337.1 helix-turn-helix domain-containing protein [Paucibacter sp. PLA-PC-4]